MPETYTQPVTISRSEERISKRLDWIGNVPHVLFTLKFQIVTTNVANTSAWQKQLVYQWTFVDLIDQKENSNVQFPVVWVDI